MEQNSSEVDSSQTDDPSLNLYLDGKVDGFLTKLSHEKDWFLYLRMASWDAYFKMAPSKGTASSKVFSKFVFGFIVRQIIRLMDNPSRWVIRL